MIRFSRFSRTYLKSELICFDQSQYRNYGFCSIRITLMNRQDQSPQRNNGFCSIRITLIDRLDQSPQRYYCVCSIRITSDSRLDQSPQRNYASCSMGSFMFTTLTNRNCLRLLLMWRLIPATLDFIAFYLVTLSPCHLVTLSLVNRISNIEY